MPENLSKIGNFGHWDLVQTLLCERLIGIDLKNQDNTEVAWQKLEKYEIGLNNGLICIIKLVY